LIETENPVREIYEISKEEGKFVIKMSSFFVLPGSPP
jgi:hypothetical protein